MGIGPYGGEAEIRPLSGGVEPRPYGRMSAGTVGGQGCPLLRMATRFAAQVRADGFDFWGSKFPGGQVAEFDLDAFIGSGFGGFLQEFFSIFV